MFKSMIASLMLALALFATSLSAPPAEAAGGLRKAAIILGTVAVSGLVIRCGVRTIKGRSCL